MKVSVIIPTRNRADLLEVTLQSLVEQTMPIKDFEVIVVDNGSTDNTPEVATRFKSLLQVKYVYEKQPGLHRGRHAGWQNARSNYLAFADDDIRAFPSWLESIYSVFEKHPKAALVGGKNLPEFHGPVPFFIQMLWNKVSTLGRSIPDLSILDFGDHEKIIPAFHVYGCNFSIRKNILEQTGGFHPDGMPFEKIEYRGDGESYVSEWVEKNGYHAYYHPGASVYHAVTKDRLSEEYFIKRKYNQGISDAYSDLRAGITRKSVKSLGLKYYLRVLIGLEQISLLHQLRADLAKTDFEKKCDSSYKNGYAFLVAQYKSRPEIKEWIHKENYLT